MKNISQPHFVLDPIIFKYGGGAQFSFVFNQESTTYQSVLHIQLLIKRFAFLFCALSAPYVLNDHAILIGLPIQRL